MIEKFCDRAILMQEGKIVKDGGASEVVQHYKT
jgi:ABC-type polysaccharide/polyol phosphate transport system ATPase subunit